MPPDVRDWLPDGHLAWFVLDAVADVDLTAFYGAYRRDGMGRPAYEPAMMVALLLYSYARGVRSARKIERACEEDVAFRVIAGLAKPDHATIARFVDKHEAALADLFGEVLRLCDEAGLVRPGVVAVDGTRLAGNASRSSNRDFEEIAREILEEAKAIDAAEDELYGEARGDELPEQLRTREGRREFSAEPARSFRPTIPPASTRAGGLGRRSLLSLIRSGSWRARRAGRGGRARRAASSSSAAGAILVRFRGTGQSGCCSRRGGWRPISSPSAPPTRLMSSFARPAGTRKDGGLEPNRTRGWNPRSRRGW